MTDYLYSAIIGACVALSLLVWQVGTQNASVTSPAPFSGTITTPREDWAVDLLEALGDGAPTDETIGFLEAWHRAEGGSAAFNPLNTTQGAPGATDYNTVGVKNYPDYETGIQATVETLQNGYYPNTLAGLVTNQPVVDDAEMGKWGTGGGAIRAQLAQAPQAQAIGQPYLLQGDVGTNVRAALAANGGALMGFTIEPGETWSFGHSIAPISAMGPLAYVNEIYAGGWCDLSAEYLKVAQQLGLEAHYVQHAGVSTPFPSIWLNDQGDGESGQDLTITNTQPAPVTFRARVEGDSLVIEGWTG